MTEQNKSLSEQVGDIETKLAIYSEQVISAKATMRINFGIGAKAYPDILEPGEDNLNVMIINAFRYLHSEITELKFQNKSAKSYLNMAFRAIPKEQEVLIEAIKEFLTTPNKG